LKPQEIDFEDYRQSIITDKDKIASVKAFEFCYELSWKMMRRLLAGRGVEANSPRSVFREAALSNIINDPEIWFKFQEKRNITAHVYNEQELNQVVAIFNEFSQELNKLIDTLSNLEI